MIHVLKLINFSFLFIYYLFLLLYSYLLFYYYMCIYYLLQLFLCFTSFVRFNIILILKKLQRKILCKSKKHANSLRNIHHLIAWHNLRDNPLSILLMSRSSPSDYHSVVLTLHRNETEPWITSRHLFHWGERNTENRKVSFSFHLTFS